MSSTHNQPPAPAASGTPVPASSSALMDNVEMRPHAAGNVSVDPRLLQTPLGEAPIGMAAATAEEDPFQKEIEQARQNKTANAGPGAAPAGKAGTAPGKGAAGKPAGKDLSNPQLQGLSPEKSKEAAENLARMILQGYARGIDFADQQLQVSEKKMLKIRAAGKIDMATPIPIEGGQVTFEEFIRTYNQQTRGTLSVDKDFMDDVLPRLTTVLAKHGQGLSDEQYLMIAFGGNIAYNAQKFIAQKAMLSQFMAFGLEMTKRNREAGAPVVPMYAPPPPPPRSETPAPPPPPPMAPARVVTMQQEAHVDNGSTEFQLPQWGSKDKMDALKKAQKKAAKKNGAQAPGRDLTADAPASRKKIRRASNKKAS